MDDSIKQNIWEYLIKEKYTKAFKTPSKQTQSLISSIYEENKQIQNSIKQNEIPAVNFDEPVDGFNLDILPNCSK